MARAPRRSRSTVTIRTVAERAGVSAMTVSNVLNGRPVKDETRQAVQEAVAELGYRPNTAAKRLAQASTLTVGILHGYPLGEIFGEILTGLVVAAPRFGIDLLLEPVDFAAEDPTGDAVRHLVARGVDGIVLPPVFAEIFTDSGHLETFDIPMATLATGRPVAGMPNVRIDEVAAARDVVGHMIARGRRAIAFVDGPAVPEVSDERRRGFLEAMGAAGLAVREDWIINAPLESRPYASVSERLLGLSDKLLAGKDRPDAVFAWNDDFAAVVMFAAHRRGLRIPEDLAVAGFDDTSMAAKLWPPLTTVRQPVRHMAEQCLARLVDRIGGKGRADEVVLIDHVLKVRGST